MPFQMICHPPAEITPLTPKSSAKCAIRQDQERAARIIPGTESRRVRSPEARSRSGRRRCPSTSSSLLNRPGRHDSAPRPRLEVLLDMAIAAKQPEEVLRWFDKMRSDRKQVPKAFLSVLDLRRSRRGRSGGHPPRSINRALPGRHQRSAPPCSSNPLMRRSSAI